MSKMSPLPRNCTSESTERREGVRQTMVLRVGTIEDDERTSFCLLKNISRTGVQVKVFGHLRCESKVRLRVGDEEPLSGVVKWVRDDVVGVRFEQMLAVEGLLRVAQKLVPNRRRSSPRVSTSACAVLRTNGQAYSAELRDISACGARLCTPKAAKLGSTVMLTLPDLPPIRTFVRWATSDEVGLAFETWLPVEIIAQWVDKRVSVLPC